MGFYVMTLYKLELFNGDAGVRCHVMPVHT